MFGAELRKARKAAKMSQFELSQRLGYTDNSMVSKLESGFRIPTPEILRKLREIFPGLPEPTEDDIVRKPQPKSSAVQYSFDAEGKLHLTVGGISVPEAKELFKFLLSLLDTRQ